MSAVSVSAVRWLHPLKISLCQRLAPESEFSLAKITLHKQRLQQIKGVSTLIWIMLHAMTVMHFRAFGLSVSLCAFKHRSPPDLQREGVLWLTDSDGYRITSINQECSCIPCMINMMKVAQIQICDDTWLLYHLPALGNLLSMADFAKAVIWLAVMHLLD